MTSVTSRAWVGLAQLTAVLALALFGGAGSLDYPAAWAFVLVFAGCSAAITAYLARHDPALLERRINAGARAEPERRQRWIQGAMGLAFVALLLVPALDRRFGAAPLAPVVVVAGDALILAGFGVIFAVFRANSFAAATVRVATGQPVVSSGPYAIVRHPMYAGALVLLAGMPLALGSTKGFAVFVPMAAAIAWRLLEEERTLRRELDGYRAYCERVRYRLVPGLW